MHFFFRKYKKKCTGREQVAKKKHSFWGDVPSKILDCRAARSPHCGEARWYSGICSLSAADGRLENGWLYRLARHDSVDGTTDTIIYVFFCCGDNPPGAGVVLPLMEWGWGRPLPL